MYSLILVSLLISAIQADPTARYCRQGNVDNLFKAFGTKTSYAESLRQWSADAPAWTPPKGFKPIFAYGFLRHATRYPSAEDIEAGVTFIEHGKFPKAMDSPTCPKSAWAPALWKAKEGMHVTATGGVEQKELAARIAHRFPELFKDLEHVEIGISNQTRTLETARYFFSSLKNHTHSKAPFRPKVSPISMFHMTCADMAGGFDTAALDKQVKRFKKREDKKELVDKVQRLLPDIHIGWSEVKLLRKACASSWAIDRQYKPLCSIFDMEDLELLDLYADLKDWWGNAYGGPKMVQEMPCVVVDDFITQLDRVSKGKSHSKAVLRFSHSGALIPLISHLRLFKESSKAMDARTILPTDDRKWHSSKICPFSANVWFIVVKKDHGHEEVPQADEELFVATLVQERLVEPDICGQKGEEGMCRLKDFKKLAVKGLGKSSCNLKKICTKK